MGCLVQCVRKAKEWCVKNTQTRNLLLGQIGSVEQRQGGGCTAHTPGAWVSGSLLTISNDILMQRQVTWVGDSTSRQMHSWVNLLSKSVGNIIWRKTWKGSSCLLSTPGLRLTWGRTTYQSWGGHRAGENRLAYKAGEPRFKNILKNWAGLKSSGLISCIKFRILIG